MSTGEPPTRRPYRSQERLARLQATRARILETARKRFAANGYSATTIDEIAGAAAIAVPTVYKHFGSKRGLLMALIDSAVNIRVGPLLEGVLAERSPRRRLAALARMCVTLAGEAPDIVSIVVRAADADSDFAASLHAMEEGRRHSAALIARSLADDGALRPASTEAEARDVIWALASPQLYEQLALRSGWGDDRFERWLVDALTRLILGD